MTGRFRGPPGPPTSALTAETWRLRDVGEVVLAVPTLQEFQALDEAWVEQRAATDVSNHWRWREIALQSPERFALRDTAGVTLALWASPYARPVSLLDGFAYRLDWLEVAPGRRRGGLGAFVMCLVAARAIEKRASLVVYGAVNDPRALAFHRALGAEEREARGWSAPPNLIPFVLAAEQVKTLAEREHGLRI
jgi:hypothetical protein